MVFLHQSVLYTTTKKDLKELNYKKTRFLFPPSARLFPFRSQKGDDNNTHVF